MTLASTAQAQHRGGGGHAGGHGSIGGLRPGGISGANRPGNHTTLSAFQRNVNSPIVGGQGPAAGGAATTRSFGQFKSTPWVGRNWSYGSRRGNWGERCWCGECGCYCYWNPDADCYYYWYEPDQCYYPLSYCPSGRYDYVEP
jgi:hypothetical protein